MSSNASSTFTALCDETRARYAVLLDLHLQLDEPLGAVARYALAGGRRLRPMLVDVIGASLGAPEPAVARIGVTVEYLHVASLLLDDLPAMDDAQERRGRVPTHLAFSQADAILAALALVSRSTMLLLDPAVGDPATRNTLATLTAQTVGPVMACGQAMEFRANHSHASAQVRHIHARKTGALFALTGQLVAIAAGATNAQTAAILRFTDEIGRAYQLIDDLEDRTAHGEAHANLARIDGVEAVRAEAHACLDAAVDAARFDGTGRLAACVDWLRGGLNASA
jgi:geranylgeranyl pyrophosphate synthase